MKCQRKIDVVNDMSTNIVTIYLDDEEVWSMPAGKGVFDLAREKAYNLSWENEGMFTIRGYTINKKATRYA